MDSISRSLRSISWSMRMAEAASLRSALSSALTELAIEFSHSAPMAISSLFSSMSWVSKRFLISRTSP